MSVGNIVCCGRGHNEGKVQALYNKEIWIGKLTSTKRKLTNLTSHKK
jgi:hypothetical protein